MTVGLMTVSPYSAVSGSGDSMNDGAKRPVIRAKLGPLTSYVTLSKLLSMPQFP